MTKANGFEAEVKNRGEELKALAIAKKISKETTEAPLMPQKLDERLALDAEQVSSVHVSLFVVAGRHGKSLCR